MIGAADESSILPGDFILPSDEPSQKALWTSFESLDLFAADDTTPTTTTTGEDDPTPGTEMSDAPRIQTYSAMMRFSMEVDGQEKKEISLSLTHDVHFVTAHPCVPSTHTEILQSPTSPSFGISGQSLTEPPGLPTGTSNLLINHFGILLI